MRKITISGPGQKMLTYESETYQKPFKEGYYGESFAILDSYIDSVVNSIIRAMFNSHKEKTLLNLIEATKKDMGDYFAGLQKIKILKKMEVISNELANTAENFKIARNKILHNPEGEYALVFSQKQYWEKYDTQEKVDREVQDQLKKIFIEGEGTYLELNEILSKIVKDPEFYNNWEQERTRKAMIKTQERKNNLKNSKL